MVGDPTVFGNNVWNVYAWDAGGAEPTPDSWNTAYPGFYPINSLNLNNQNQWNANNSPSSAGSGCQAQLRIYDAAGRSWW
ncbi:MAG: hypothetical protein IPK76_14485 [Lewinellaceae bacterium]|nr:hypothetical protein [Lewinellaceae bacterium]